MNIPPPPKVTGIDQIKHRERPIGRDYGLFALVAIVIAIPVFVDLAPIVSAYTGGHRSAKGSACLSNLKHIGMSVLAYAQDWDDRLPAKEAWVDLTVERTKSYTAYRCPSARTDGFSYSYNAILSKSRTDRFAYPAETPIAYDSTSTNKNAYDYVTSLPPEGRHNGRNAMVHLDGHVKAVGP